MSILATLLAVLTTFIFIIIIKWVLHRYRSHQVLKRYGIPGPEPSFFDGHLSEIKKKPTPHDIMDYWQEKYGNVYGYYLGEEPYIVVHDIEIVKQVLIKDFSVFINRPTLFMNVKPMDKTIIGLNDQRWKEVRTIISPTFSTSKLKLLKTIFDKKVDITVDVVNKKVKNNEMFDIYEIMQGLTLDVIADCALALKTRCQENPNDKLLTSMRNFQTLFYSSAIKYGIIFPILDRIFTFAVNYLTPHSGLNAYILNNLNRVIAERRKKPDFRSMDVLQLLMDNSEEGSKNSNKLTTEEVIANAYVTLLAGFETTSTALGFTFHLLVKHPEIQERLFEEIDKAPNSNYDTLQNLTYLDQVFNESLRLYPPVTTFISRICKEDHKIGSYTFPKDSNVLIPIWHMHHDPDLFPEPWKFNPDRFSPENKASIKNMSFLPFGDGPRNCIGARFALLEAKLAIFMLIKKFKFIPCEKTEENLTLVSPTLVINPVNGVWVRAIPREI